MEQIQQNDFSKNLKNTLIVEFVIPQIAEKGGLDRMINDFSNYISKQKDMELHIVQLVDSGLVWWNEKIDITSLCNANENPSFIDTANKYRQYLNTVERKPDIIVATGWPITITIVREALRQMNQHIPLIGYPHMTLLEGELTGVGGVMCLTEADGVLVISKQIEDEILKSGLSIPWIRVDDGIQFPDKVQEREAALSCYKLLYIGRLVDGKNLPMVFKALSLTQHNWQLKVVGQGELEKAKRIAEEYHVLENITFFGFLENPYEVANDISFCIMPSNYEGFCLVIPEALSRGIPVISTPVGCATEVIKPGVNGYLVPINDAKMLAEILDYIAAQKLPIPDPIICRNTVENYELSKCLERLQNGIWKMYSYYETKVKEKI